MNYQVRLAPKVRLELNRVSGRTIKYINEQLGKRPDVVGAPLSGNLKGCFVVKHQQHRIIYRVDHAAATVDILEII